MKYFTKELIERCGSPDDAAAHSAGEEWEAALERYDAYWQTIRLDMPESVRRLDESFCLHDARVLSMGQRGDTFVISLQLDAPSNQLLTITYTLAGSPEINKEPFGDGKNESSPWWLYEEIERVKEGDRPYFIHSILFSNGWEASIPFREVHMDTADLVYPLLHHSVEMPAPVVVS
jgi:hypothetical protein